jgi:hypothetical protein
MTVSIIREMARGETPSYVPLTVEQYHEMTRLGILPEGAPIELLDGLLVYKDRGDSKSSDPLVHGPDHVLAAKLLLRVVDVLIADLDCHSQFQLPITLPPEHEPEPDVSIVRGTPRDYASAVPTGDDTLAAMEVAHTSRRLDRGSKLAAYAGAGIPTYVVVDLVNDVIEVYTNPFVAESRFDRLVTHRRGDRVVLALAGEEVTFAVDDVLP